VRRQRGAYAVCLRAVAGQTCETSSSLAQQFATRYTSQDRDQITKGIEYDFLDSQPNLDTQHPTHSIEDYRDRT
jgi:hypothetical protein